MQSTVILHCDRCRFLCPVILGFAHFANPHSALAAAPSDHHRVQWGCHCWRECVCARACASQLVIDGDGDWILNGDGDGDFDCACYMSLCVCVLRSTLMGVGAGMFIDAAGFKRSRVGGGNFITNLYKLWATSGCAHCAHSHWAPAPPDLYPSFYVCVFARVCAVCVCV